MAKMQNLDEWVALHRRMVEVLSEYGVDRAGIDSALEIVLDHGEAEYAKGWADATNKIAEG